MSDVTFHPRALLVSALMILLLWAATDLRWGIALATAIVLYDLLSFAGVLGVARR